MHEDEKIRADLAPLLERYRQTFRYLWFGLVALLIMGVLLFFYIGSVKQNEAQALTNTQALSEQTKNSTICSTFPDDPLCKQARQIADDPTATVAPVKGEKGDKGNTGQTGEPGRGVTSFTQKDGDLVVSYTDGTTEDVGRIVGKDGIAGATGKDGKDGRGILSTDLQSGSLIINFTDGTSQNLGIIVGPAGDPGQTGATGATGPKGDTGATGATGAQGVPGISVTSVRLDATNNVLVTYSDGRQEVAGQIIFNTIKYLVCNQDTNVLTIGMTDGSAFSATVDCSPDNSPIPQVPSNTAPQTSTTPLTSPLK